MALPHYWNVGFSQTLGVHRLIMGTLVIFKFIEKQHFDQRRPRLQRAIKEMIKWRAGAADVLDVGVCDASDVTAYPHPAVDAGKKMKAGEPSTVLTLSILVV